MTPGAPPGEERRGRLVFAGEVSRLRLTGGAPGADLFRVWPAPGGRASAWRATWWSSASLALTRPRDGWPRRRAPPKSRSAPAYGGRSRSAARRPTSPPTCAASPSPGSSSTGGAARVTVALPAPLGTVPVRILGGASHVAIHRPPGVPVRLRVDGGATAVTLDDQRVGVAGGSSPCTPPGTGAPPGATRSPSPGAPTCWPWGWTRHSAKAPEGLDRDQPQDDRAL